MKGNSKLFSIFFLTGLTLFSSCKDKDNDPEDSKGDEGYVAPKGWAQGSSTKYVDDAEKVQSVNTQQKQLEATAIAFANHHKVSNFRDLVNLARYANNHYIDNDRYNTDAVEDFFDATLDLITSVNKNPMKQEEYFHEYVYADKRYDYESDDYKYVGQVSRYEEKINGYFIKFFQAAQFYGHFQADKKGWTQVPGKFNDLQFEFQDENGKPCVLKAKVSGKEQTVYVTQDDDNWIYNSYNEVWVDKDTVLTVRDYDWENDSYEYKDVKVDGYYLYRSEETYDVNDIKVSVPEHVELTLTQDGKTVVSTEVDLNLSGIENERLNVNKTMLGFKTKTKVGPTEFVVNKFDYKNASKSDYSMFSTINGKKLWEVSGEFLSEINYKGDQKYQYLEELMEDIYDDRDASVSKFTGVVANVNILNEVQIKASISDAKKLIDLFDDAYDHDEEEAYFKNKVAEINKLINMGLYYYGGSKLQAKVRLEPFEDEDDEWWYGNDGEYGHKTYTYWDMEPVIEFSNGQTYSMDEFFNEDDFKSFVELIEEIGDDYEDELDF